MKILFIGSRLFNDVAGYASGMGVTTILSESNPRAPNLELADEFFILPRGMEAPMELAIHEDVDAVIPLIGVDGPLREVAWMKQELEGEYGIPVVASGPEVASISTDKLKTKEFFTENDIRTPEYRFISSPHVKALPAVLKQREGQGGSDIRIISSEAELEDYLRVHGSAIMEEYIQGHEISVEVLRWKGRSLPLVAVDKGLTSTEGIHPLRKIKRAPAAIRGFDNSAALEMACRITDLLGAEGNTDVDMILSDDGELHAIEVNTRPNGTRYISGAATGINPMHSLVDMAIGNWAPERLERKAYHAVEIPLGSPDTERVSRILGDASWTLHGPENHRRITVWDRRPERLEEVVEELRVIS
ncbi:ATP-grasp domain-containing protein [Methanothermobacter wolfeii]|uniref:ATP-grasp domain-containing protein n=1 Tax=Methanothermobacter wolfeii TaxID=145261 RepID=UPI000941F9EC